jgi:trehalose-6-phosphatase
LGNRFPRSTLEGDQAGRAVELRASRSRYGAQEAARPSGPLINTYSAAQLRIIFLDYDGTLVAADKIASDAACAAGPPSAVIKLLKFLSEDPNTVVFLMSGRTRSVLTDWFGDLVNLGLAAEKGLFLRWPQRLAASCRFDLKQDDDDIVLERRGGASSTDESSDESESESDSENEDDKSAGASHTSAAASPIASNVREEDWECIIPLEDIAWKATASEIIRAYTEQTDGSYIEDKEFSLTWHYEVTNEHTANPVTARFCMWLIYTRLPFVVSAGAACRCGIW